MSEEPDKKPQDETAPEAPETEAAAPESPEAPEAPETEAAPEPAATADAEADESEAPAEKPKRRPRRKAAAPEAEAAAPEAEAAEPKAETAEPKTEAAKPKAKPARSRGAKPSQPAKPTASRRRRSRRDPDRPAPVVRAQAKYVRSSARKARLVCDHIRGKSVEEARAILALTPRAIARDWSKLLESAVANAEHNHELVGEDLYVKAVHADEGPTIKRFRPRAMGRASRIRKRTSHLTILLTPKD